MEYVMIAQQALDITPNNRHAEQSVLGGILIDENAIDKVLDVLSADGRAFYIPAHRVLFTIMVSLSKKRVPIDALTVMDAVSGDALDSVGGGSYVVELMEMTPTASNVEHYAFMVKEDSLRRHIISQARDLIGRAQERKEKAEDIITSAQQGFIKSDQLVKQEYFEIKSLLNAVYDDIDGNKGQRTGLETGLTSLDNKLGGFQKTDLVLIAGRPSMGKTALAVQIATHIAKQGHRVGFFSIEVGKIQLIKNIYANQAKINTNAFRDRTITDEESSRIVIFNNSTQDLSFRIDDRSRSSLDISRQARKMMVDGGLDIIFIDHLQLMRENIKGLSRNNELEIITGNLKALAKELNIPIVGLSQLSRNVEHRGGDCKPVMSDLRESGAIEQDADVVMFVYREEYYNKEKTKEERRNIAEIQIGKNRNGALGSSDFRWTPQFVRFDNLQRY
jgi:replicative DNA helicase